MATKKDNIMTFYSSEYGYFELVKRSVGKYTEFVPDIKITGAPYRDTTPDPPGRNITYWHGQYIRSWGHPEDEHYFSRGQVIWLDAAVFFQIPATDYIEYVNT